MMKPVNSFLNTPRMRIAVLSVALFVFSCSARAATDTDAGNPKNTLTFPASSWTHEKTYRDKTTNKLGFGFLNLTAGWTAFFYELKRARYFFDGLGRGSLYAITNTAGGVLHAATFPVPVDIPLPQGGISYEYNR